MAKLEQDFTTTDCMMAGDVIRVSLDDAPLVTATVRRGEEGSGDVDMVHTEEFAFPFAVRRGDRLMFAPAEHWDTED